MLIDPVKMCRKGGRRSLRDSNNFIHGNNVVMSRNRRKTYNFCAKEPEMIHQARRGAHLATKECQFQFRDRQWNCSALPRSIRRVLSKGE